MAYISKTHPGIVRGPHEHRHQSDLFIFFDGTFEIYLWDDREDSDSYGHRQVLVAGSEEPASLIVPPGVVHAYKNVGSTEGLIINCPNRLYAGWNREEEVDEIRYEEKSDHPFTLDGHRSS
jgi:dTDP-4-dehydrorhamnose 3,5-epimerase